MLAKLGCMERSFRLLRPEKIPVLENLLTPVRKTNSRYASLSFRTE
jgi:hypothetical protein